MKGLLIFLGGMATGVACSFVYVTKCLIPELKKEAERKQAEELALEHVAEDIPDYSSEEAAAEPSETGLDMKKVVEKNRSEKQYLDYTKFSGEEKAKKEETETDTYGIGPYIIDEDSFDEYSLYRAKTFQVYSDGVIFDDEEDDELDADPEIVFGKTALEELKTNPVVCVRDDARKFTYRLERQDVPFNGPDDILPPPREIDWGE